MKLAQGVKRFSFFLLLTGLLSFSSAYSDPSPSRCEDQIDKELKALVDSDYKGILSQQLQLTTLKLALETKKAKTDTASVEEYLKKEFDRIGGLDRSGVREKLEALYEKRQLPADLKTLSDKLKNANYFKRPLRFKNEELSLYVLAHQELQGKESVYNRMDSAILWYQSQLAAKSTAKPGTSEANLLQATTLAGIYSGLMSGVKKWSADEIENRISYLKNEITEQFKKLSQSLIARMDPKCKTEMPCFNCSTNPEKLEDRLAGLLQGTKRVLEAASPDPSPIAKSSTPPSVQPSAQPSSQPTTPLSASPVASAQTIRIELEKTIVSTPVDETLKNVNAGAVTDKATVVQSPIPVVERVENKNIPPEEKKNEAQPTMDQLFQVADSEALLEAPLKKEVFERAYKGWSKIKKSKGCGSRVMVVDFDYSKSKPRAYLIDMSTGHIVLQSYTSHALDSDRNGDGIPEDFSMVGGSLKTALGFYQIKDKNYAVNRKPPPSFTEYGPVIQLAGLDPKLNGNAVGRAIYVHGEPSGYQFSSFGCFVFGSQKYRDENGIKYYPKHDHTIQEVYDNMSNGDLVFAYSSKTDTQNVDRDSNYLN